MGRPRKHPKRQYRCIEAFAGTNPDGSPNGCKVGDVLPEDHPLVRGNPNWFVSVDDGYAPRPEVEQATAAPGEKRGEVK